MSTHPALERGRIRGSELSKGFVLTIPLGWRKARDCPGRRGCLLLISSEFFSPALSQRLQTKETFAVAAALEAAVFEVLLFICKGWLVYGKTAQKQSLG